MIDTSAWKEFRVGELFEFESIKQARSQRAVPDDISGIPYVVQSKYNNMVARCVNRQWLIDNNEPPVKGNAIALGVTLNCVSYQEDEFGASQIIVARNDNLNFYIGNFVATILARATERFTYREKPGLQKYKDTIIKLPATSDGQPDWGYMESYMKAVMEESEEALSNLKKADDAKHLVDVNGWGEFRIGDVFDVVKGSRLTKANMRGGAIKFIGSSAINNGETHRIANDEKIHPANTITVCYNGSVGETFYQDERFWASDDVNVFYPKFNMTKLVAMFICPIIKSIGQKYAFIDKWKQEDMKNDIIKLPITPTGEPDWQYMEDYMKSIMNKQEMAADNLSKIV